MTQQDLDYILTDYGLAPIVSYNLLTGGSENTNYLVRTTNGNYVVTICEQKSVPQAQELAHLLGHLATNNFKTSRVVYTVTQKAVVVWNGKPVIVKHYLEGKIMAQLPDALLTKVGQQMGKLHQISAPDYLPNTLSYGLESFSEIEEYMPNTPFGAWLAEIKTKIASLDLQALPKCLIHSDIFYSNIIVSADATEVRIMDFEEAAYYYRIFDVGMSIIGLCENDGGIAIHKAQALLHGYQKEICLSQTEKEALQAFTVYAAAAMAFWRHKNFNHVHPEPHMYNHYKQLQEVANAVRSLPSAEFLGILNG